MSTASFTWFLQEKYSPKIEVGLNGLSLYMVCNFGSKENKSTICETLFHSTCRKNKIIILRPSRGCCSYTNKVALASCLIYSLSYSEPFFCTTSMFLFKGTIFFSLFIKKTIPTLGGQSELLFNASVVWAVFNIIYIHSICFKKYQTNMSKISVFLINLCFIMSCWI